MTNILLFKIIYLLPDDLYVSFFEYFKIYYKGETEKDKIDYYNDYLSYALTLLNDATSPNLITKTIDLIMFMISQFEVYITI